MTDDDQILPGLYLETEREREGPFTEAELLARLERDGTDADRWWVIRYVESADYDDGVRIAGQQPADRWWVGHAG